MIALGPEMGVILVRKVGVLLDAADEYPSPEIVHSS